MQSDKGKATALACIKENKDNLILWDRYHPISLFSIVEKKRNPESQVCYLMKISGWRDRRARYTTPLKSQIIERLSLLDHLLLSLYLDLQGGPTSFVGVTSPNRTKLQIGIWKISSLLKAC